MALNEHDEYCQGAEALVAVSWPGQALLSDSVGERNLGAVVLAAGLSQRMGRLKQLLPLEGRPLLQWVVELYHQAGVRQIVVVTGHHAEELRPAIKELGASEAHNQLYNDGMFGSVVCGVGALPDSLDAFFLHPVDLPLVRPLSIACLLRAWRSPAEVLHPTWLGAAGHPPLIGNKWRGKIRAWSGENGLAGLWRQHPQGQREVPVADRFITKDLDLPGDYKAMNALAPRWEIPSRQECLELINQVLGLPAPLAAHCRAVAHVCLSLGQTLNDAGAGLDLELLQAAALLHDLARGQADHARLGAAWLGEMGFGALSPLVGSHMELDPSQNGRLSEAEVLFLADKLVKRDRVTGLAQRFAAKENALAGDTRAMAALKRRSRVAEILASRFEAQTGQPLAWALAGLKHSN
jgi:molybdenum cofactor cytidylyltransferase